MHWKYLVAGLIALGCLTVVGEGQEDFWESPQAYLSQPRPSDTPQIFAPNLLAPPGTIAMDRITFSLDGREIYYYQADRWGSLANAKILSFRYDGQAWSKPILVAEHLFAVTMAPDNSTLYFEDDDPKHMWRSERTKESKSGWTAPVEAYKEPFGMYSFTPTKSGTIYISAESGTEDKKHGITSSFSTMTISNAGTNVQNLGTPLNEPGYNGEFYIAPDESYMVVSAKETKTNECELYLSFRKSDATWTEPVSLGPKINDGLAHRWGQYVTPDGKYLFYTRGTSSKDSAVYWVRFDKLLASLRPKN